MGRSSNGRVLALFEILTIVVFLNAMATITLWQRAARRPEKPKGKFRNRLWRSEPITPKHQPPPPLKEGLFVREAQLQFFSDFEDFANVINSWLTDQYVHPHGSPWRLQELPKSELLKLYRGSGGPVYGRTYAVFHNQVRVGEIEVEPDWKYSTQEPRVTVHIELRWVRLLAAGTIRGFLIDIAQQVSEYHLEYLQINQEIDLALLGVLWETQEISEFGMENEPGYGEIEVQFSGLARSYIHRRQYLRDEAAKAKQQTAS